MFRFCERCGEHFETQYSFAKLCKPCFVESKKEELEDLKDEVAYWKQRYEMAVKGRNDNQGKIPADMLKRMIYLCHPDKHQGSEMAHKVTVYLMALHKP